MSSHKGERGSGSIFELLWGSNVLKAAAIDEAFSTRPTDYCQQRRKCSLGYLINNKTKKLQEEYLGLIWLYFFYIFLNSGSMQLNVPANNRLFATSTSMGVFWQQKKPKIGR